MTTMLQRRMKEATMRMPTTGTTLTAGMRCTRQIRRAIMVRIRVITLRMEMRKGVQIMRRMMRTWKLVAAGMGVGMRVGVRNNGKEGYGSCSVSGRKDDEGRNGTKRKN